eukprot:825688-Ditylum_brightwellii.AAC.1
MNQKGKEAVRIFEYCYCWQPKDVDLSETAFGQDVDTIKGKTTRKRPTPIEDNSIKIPSKLLSIHQDVAILIDGLKTNHLHFLTPITNNIYYRTVQYTKDNIAEVYEQCFDELIASYKKGGFNVVGIHCNN